MINARLFFKKYGDLKYISHLDLNRLMLRALKRASLPVWYTEGYNPHMYITFALPLSLGYESDYEIMDLRLEKEISFDEIKQRINDVLPEGIEIIKAANQKKKTSDIAFADYEIKIFCEDIQKCRDSLIDFFAQETILTEKKTKKGSKTIDLKPDTEITGITAQNGSVVINLRLPAGSNKNINPSLIIDSFMNFSKITPRLTCGRRTAVLCSDKQLFE